MMYGWTRVPRETFLLALVCLAAALPFANSLGNDFTFDDVEIIRDNPLLRRDSPTPLLRGAYLQGAMYRPLTMLTYYANAHLDPSPVGFHLFNTALHVVVTALVFYLTRTLLSSAWMATVSAALFAVHPIHTEAVTSIVGRSELLAAFSVLATLLSFIQARRSGGRCRVAWQAVSLLVFLAGLLAKEGAFAALPLLFVVHVWLFREEKIRHRAALLVPYAAITLAVLGLRLAVIGSLTSATPTNFLDNPLAYVPWLPRLRTAIVILWEYVSQLAFPWNLSADYSFNQIPIVTSSLDPRFVGAAAFLLFAGAAVSWSAFRARTALLAALLLMIPLAITANLLFPIGTIKAERLLYLPSVGWCILCAFIASRTVRLHPQATVAILTILVLGYAGRTWARNAVWTDNLTLFQATVNSSPANAKAHYNLATANFEAGRFDEAMLHYRQALAIFPGYANAAFAVGRIYDVKGLDAGALHWYERALRSSWENVNAHLNLGTVRLRLGETASAEASFLTGLQLDPNNRRLLFKLALVRRMQGWPWAAEILLEKVEGVDASKIDGLAFASLWSPTTMEQP
jgi:tetratricopeptide (TPR) repeat protein